MKLTKISAKNLKGLSFDLSLSDVTFLVGSNFAGKSARTDAIRLLLVGHLPELGKLNSATFGLCSGKELIVEGEFDDGSKLRRRWYLKGDSVKTEQEIPDAFLDKGPLSIMLNAEDYFSLSERERVDYVFDNIPGTGSAMEASQMSDRIEQGLKDVEETTPESIARVTAAIAAGTEAKINAEAKKPTGSPPKSRIDHSLDAASEEECKAKEVSVRMEKTVQGIAQLRLQDAPPADVPAMEVRIKELDGKRDAAREELFKVGEAQRKSEEVKRRGAELVASLALKAAHEQNQAVAMQQLQNIKARISVLPDVACGEIARCQTEDRDASAAAAGHKADLRNVEESIDRNERDLAEIEAKTACPYCGAAGENWKQTKRAEIESALAGLRVKKTQIEKHVEKLSNHANANRETAASLTRRRDQKRDESNAAKNVLSNLETINSKLSDLREKEKALETLAAENPSGREQLDDRSFREAVTNLDAQISRANEELRSALARSGELKRLAQAEKDRDEAKIDQIVAKAAGNILRELRAEIVEKAFAPLLATANGFFSEVLKTPIAYHAGEIGTWREGAWVGHRTMSGTEKLLVYAAIQAALAARSPVKMMILDELGRLDQENLAHVVSAAGAFSGGPIDQLIGIDVGRADLYRGMSAAFKSCSVLEIS